MNLNISYYLEPCGWSYCNFEIEEKKIEVRITHIFSDNPIEACIKSLISILKGHKSSKFTWFDEPGGVNVEIKKVDSSKELFNIKINWFGDTQDEFLNETQFKIKKKILIVMFYSEFNKLNELLKDKDYSKNRGEYFPFQEFKLFEKEVKIYLRQKSL